MTAPELRKFRERYEDNLLRSVEPFWERHSPDRERGGYFSCLDRDGTVFDTDKFVWMQARAVWTFSRLCRRYADDGPGRARRLELARLGADFLREHGRSPGGDWYFALDRAGRPLVEPYNIFSDYFAAAGLAEYHRVSGERWALDEALRTWRRIGERKARPKGVWTKQIGENRPLKAMGLPMMDTWLAGELRGLAPAAELDAAAAAAEEQVFSLHVDRKARAVFERVLPDGGHPDCMDGRLLNPGHALETLWFLLRNARARGDAERMEDIADLMLWCAERGWDREYGGFFYYRDFRGFPTEKLESDMKLWWVHAEALCAFLLAWRCTGRPELEAWFRRTDEYVFERFVDRERGEWYGYLDRRGETALTLKGGKWKGFFHVPRALMVCIDLFAETEGTGATAD